MTLVHAIYVGGMRTMNNEEILERLYEEALDELSLKEFSYWLRSATSNKSYKPNSKEFIQECAVELAKKRFEEQAQ